MVLLLLLYTFVVPLSFIFFIVHWKLIRSQKRFYDTFRSQGVPGEPFVSLVGQLSEMRRASEKDAGIAYRLELVQKHGYLYLTRFGPYIRLSVMEPDMISDIFGRSHAQDYRKPTNIDKVFKSLIGVHNLLVSEGSEHERARKMLNSAFHFVKLQSMLSVMVEETAKAINELLLSSTQQKVIDLQTELNTLTLAIIASSAFGKGFETMANAKQIVCRAFIEVLEAIEYRTMCMIQQIPIIAQLPF
ncbi:unnamed protein product [Didymodactylos carnosus]|uniref:Cytochrome P450 n=1 Tax=Didymodactylos carnosus TaxID=1234261 RepID=A0A816B7H8_9BILA|nr:unnamed protein product [Didymodactylos carnosus]CAF4482913.1 unnamed protein product [Didymodactylos carnosus]